MARKIPVGDVFEELPLEIPDTSRLDRGLHGPQLALQSLGSAGPQYDRASAAQAFQGPPRNPSIRSTPVQAALAAEARAPSSARTLTTAVLKSPVSSIRSAGEATGKAGVKYGGEAVKAVEQAGRAVGKMALSHSNALISGAAATVGHGNAYFDPKVPVADKLRIGATDATRALAIGTGSVFGGGVGSVVPVAGTIAGTLAGGYAGDRFGHKVGNFVFGGDEALARHGYDPNRGVWETGRDLVGGKGDAAFGVRTPTALPVGAGRGPGDGAYAELRTDMGGRNRAPLAGVAALPAGNSTAGAGRGGGYESIRTDAPIAPADAETRTNYINSFSGEDSTEHNLRAAQISEDTMNMGIRNTPGGGFTQPIEAVNSIDKRNMRFDREQQLSTLDRAARLGSSRGERAAASAAYARLAEQPAPWEAAREGERQQTGQTARAGIREAGENSRAAILNNAAARRDEVTMRGQDLELAGRKGSLLADAAKNAQDQANKDRQFKLDVEKFGVEQAKVMQAERSARESQVQKNIEAATVDPTTGKPDATAAAEYRRGLDRALARVNAKGMHELDPTDEQKLFAASDMLKTMKANASWLPWKPDTLKTIDPYDLTNLRVLPNGDRQITRSGKAAGQIIPARFFNTEEGVRFYGGTPTNKYDILSGGK